MSCRSFVSSVASLSLQAIIFLLYGYTHCFFLLALFFWEFLISIYTHSHEKKNPFLITIGHTKVISSSLVTQYRVFIIQLVKTRDYSQFSCFCMKMLVM